MLSLLYRLADAARNRIRQRQWPADQALGRRGEDLAHRFLRRRGYTVVARNYRPRAGAGEIDLIAWQQSTLVFIEVKTRTSDEFGSPERNVDLEKKRDMERVARDYARRTGVDWNRARFDVVTIIASSPPRIALRTNILQNGKL